MTHRIWLTVDLIIQRRSRLVDHNPAKCMLVLTLQRLDDLVGFVWLEVHFRIVDNVGTWRCRETQVDFGVGIVRVALHEVYPVTEGDVRIRASVRMVEVCSSRALARVVELDKQKVKRRGFYCIGQMGVWDYALWTRIHESASHVQGWA